MIAVEDILAGLDGAGPDARASMSRDWGSATSPGGPGESSMDHSMGASALLHGSPSRDGGGGGAGTAYRDCWDALVGEVQWHFDRNEPVCIYRGFGSIQYRQYNLGIRIPHFELAPKFAATYDLVRDPRANAGHANDVVQMDMARVAANAGVALADFHVVVGEIIGQVRGKRG